MSLADKITREKMYANDKFSQWLGIEILETGLGKSKLRMTVRKEMTNGMGIAHGGISYSLADSCFAFASNSHGRIAVSIETSISHTAKVNVGDVLTAEATQLSSSYKTAIYSIEVTNQDNRVIGLFKGTVYISSKEWV